MLSGAGEARVIRILHTADCHLDSPLKSLALRGEVLRDDVQAATRQAFGRIVEAALARDVAALLIAGDLFDGAQRSARTAAFLTGQFDRLNAAGIAVFCIRGNHDAENPITGEMTLPGNVHVFDGRGGRVRLANHDVWIHGVSFAGRHAPESLLGRFDPPVPDAVNIALLHTSLGGAAGHDSYAPCSVAELARMGFDYWALGHVHKRQVHAEAPWIVMPGIPQGRDIGEAGPKSATLLNIEGRAIRIEEVPTSIVEFGARDVDVSGIDSDEALRAHLREVLKGLAGELHSDRGLVRLSLRGETPRRWQILRDREVWSETLDMLAAETGRLGVEGLAFELREPGEIAPDTVSASEELGSLMTAIMAEESFALEMRAELEAVLAELSAHRRALLVPDEESAATLAQGLAKSGALRVLAMMKGAGS
jgi:DNA repair protein SbcD/Mre11